MLLLAIVMVRMERGGSRGLRSTAAAAASVWLIRRRELTPHLGLEVLGLASELGV